MKIASTIFVLGLACSHASAAQESPAYLGAADCKVEPVHPRPEGEVSWKGKCEDGYAQGPGVLEWQTSKSGKYRLDATLVRGQVEGEATLKWPNGTVYTGTFRNGSPHGKGYFRYADGMQYEGDVQNGRREGTGEGVYTNGNHYWGQWKDGRRHGTGKMEYMLGGQYEGEWKFGKRDGQGTLTYAGSGRKYTGRFVDDRPEGVVQVTLPNKEYSLKSDDSPTGSHLKVEVARTVGLPLNLSYQDFSPEQKLKFNSYYPALEEGDEPPYPLNGPQEFYKLMSKLTGYYRAKGDLKIFVLVGADGRAESVTMLGLQDAEVRRLAGTGAGLLKYKPALCRGQPCPMMFEFNFALEPAL